jgi:hypothetical protein
MAEQITADKITKLKYRIWAICGLPILVVAFVAELAIIGGLIYAFSKVIGTTDLSNDYRCNIFGGAVMLGFIAVFVWLAMRFYRHIMKFAKPFQTEASIYFWLGSFLLGWANLNFLIQTLAPRLK